MIYQFCESVRKCFFWNSVEADRFLKICFAASLAITMWFQAVQCVQLTSILGFESTSAF